MCGGRGVTAKMQQEVLQKVQLVRKRGASAEEQRSKVALLEATEESLRSEAERQSLEVARRELGARIARSHELQAQFEAAAKASIHDARLHRRKNDSLKWQEEADFNEAVLRSLRDMKGENIYGAVGKGRAPPSLPHCTPRC